MGCIRACICAKVEQYNIRCVAQPVIYITTGFDGDYLEVFGVKEPTGDVVMVVSRPARDMEVRMKEQKLGGYAGWGNGSSVIYTDMLAYYAVAASQDIGNIADLNVFKGLEIGAVHLPFGHKGVMVSKVQTIKTRRSAIKSFIICMQMLCSRTNF